MGQGWNVGRRVAHQHAGSRPGLHTAAGPRATPGFQLARSGGAGLLGQNGRTIAPAIPAPGPAAVPATHAFICTPSLTLQAKTFICTPSCPLQAKKLEGRAAEFRTIIADESHLLKASRAWGVHAGACEPCMERAGLVGIAHGSCRGGRTRAALQLEVYARGDGRLLVRIASGTSNHAPAPPRLCPADARHAAHTRGDGDGQVSPPRHPVHRHARAGSPARALSAGKQAGRQEWGTPRPCAPSACAPWPPCPTTWDGCRPCLSTPIPCFICTPPPPFPSLLPSSPSATCAD